MAATNASILNSRDMNGLCGPVANEVKYSTRPEAYHQTDLSPGTGPVAAVITQMGDDSIRRTCEATKAKEASRPKGGHHG